MEWTAQTVKDKLPGVDVLVNRKRYIGRVLGRLNDFATVQVTINPKLPTLQADFAWEVIVRSLNSGRPLRF